MQRWMTLFVAGGMFLWLSGQTRGQVSSGLDRLLPSTCQGGSAVLDITADRMIFEQQTRTFIFEEHVRLQQCGVSILCDRLQVISSHEGQNVERIIATGHVHLQQGTRHVEAQRAEYFADDQRVVLTGAPRAWDTQEQQEMTGEEMILHLRQERVIVKHARVLFRPRNIPTTKP